MPELHRFLLAAGGTERVSYSIGSRNWSVGPGHVSVRPMTSSFVESKKSCTRSALPLRPRTLKLPIFVMKIGYLAVYLYLSISSLEDACRPQVPFLQKQGYQEVVSAIVQVELSNSTLA